MKKTIGIFIAFMLLITLLPEQKTEAAGKFSDVPSNHWALKEIEFLSSQGVITGFKNGEFQAESLVTRGQAAIMLVRALNLNINNRPNPGFKDVPTTHSAYKYIATLVDENIFPKQANYGPDWTLTREYMAYLLVKAYGFQGSKNVTFSDVSKSHWAQPYISLLAENGITAGYSNGTFKPSGSVTRAQFSVFLSRVLDERFKVPSIGSHELILMKDIKFGMTYQQIKSKETKDLFFQYYDRFDSSFLEYYAEKYGITDTHLVYSFKNDQLSNVWYNFNPSKSYISTNNLWNAYYGLKEEAITEFGTNYYSKEPSSTNYINASTLWTMDNYFVLLNVKNTAGVSEASLFYSPKNYSSASFNDDEKQVDILIEQFEKYKKQLNN